MAIDSVRTRLRSSPAAGDGATSLSNTPSATTLARPKRDAKPKPASANSSFLAIGPMITLLAFSTAMLVLPLATYMIIRHYFVDSTTMAAMGAVVVVQIIVAVYIYRAWQEESRDFAAEQKNAGKLKKR